MIIKFAKFFPVISTQRLCDLPADLIRSASQRIAVQVRISLRGGDLLVTKQLAEDRQPESAAGSEARERVPQVVNANSFEPSAHCNHLPGSVKIGARLVGKDARYDISPKARQIGE